MPQNQQDPLAERRYYHLSLKSFYNYTAIESMRNDDHLCQGVFLCAVLEVAPSRMAKQIHVNNVDVVHK